MVEALTFFTRLFKQLGVVEGSDIEGLLVRFNSGVTLVPTKYLSNFSINYRFPDQKSETIFTWDFSEVSDLCVTKVSYWTRRSRFVQARYAILKGIVIDLRSVDVDE